MSKAQCGKRRMSAQEQNKRTKQGQPVPAARAAPGGATKPCPLLSLPFPHHGCGGTGHRDTCPPSLTTELVFTGRCSNLRTLLPYAVSLTSETAVLCDVYVAPSVGCAPVAWVNMT